MRHPAVDPHPHRPGLRLAALRPTLGATGCGGAGLDAEQESLLTGGKRRNMAASRKGILTSSKEAEAIARKSKLTQKDIEELDRLVKKGIAKRHGRA